jgi:pyruvate, water dikinase
MCVSQVGSNWAWAGAAIISPATNGRNVLTGSDISFPLGETGKVYDGELPFEVVRVASAMLPRPRTAIMVNLGNP